MRITNTMMAGKMYNSITKNKSIVDKYYTQLATGKQIQYASDNPILASRVLKYRTTIAEAEQFKRNAQQGYSWLEISEQAVGTLQEMMDRIRDLAEQGANDTYDISDREKIATDIKNLMSEVGAQMNQTYGGRYVFSGYKTDIPAVFDTSNDFSYQITQSFNYLDLENFKFYSKTGLDDAAQVSDATRIRLPYKNITDKSITFTDSLGSDLGIPVTEYSSSDAGAYTPASDEVYYIKDTGELIIGSDVASDLTALGRDGFSITYDKTGYAQGEINPKVYFDCTDIKPDSQTYGKSYTMNNQNIEYEFGINIKISVNNLAKDMFTANMYADFMEFCTFADNIKISERRDLELKYSGDPYFYTGDELTKAVDDQLEEETKYARSVSQSRFESLMGTIDKYMSTISKQRTDLGSRMSRLELIESRLGDDIVSYKDLLSENEDADMSESIMNLSIAEAIYQASLQVGARIMQTSLVDYLR